MHNIEVLLLGAGVLLNSASIIVLSIAVKKQSNRAEEVNSRTARVFSDNQKYKTFANDCFKNFCYVKDGFRKIRKELIKTGVLDQEFEYLHEDEAMEEFIEYFLEEEKEVV